MCNHCSDGWVGVKGDVGCGGAGGGMMRSKRPFNPFTATEGPLLPSCAAPNLLEFRYTLRGDLRGWGGRLETVGAGAVHNHNDPPDHHPRHDPPAIFPPLPPHPQTPNLNRGSACPVEEVLGCGRQMGRAADGCAMCSHALPRYGSYPGQDIPHIPISLPFLTTSPQHRHMPW